jgi:hypothetical protein
VRAPTEAALLFPIVFIEPVLCQIAPLVFLALGTRAARKSGWTQDAKDAQTASTMVANSTE